MVDEEATVYVRELDLFVTARLLEDAPAVLSLGKLCEKFGYSYHWMSGQKPHQEGKNIHCDTSNHVPFVVPGLSTSSSALSTSPTSSSQETVTDTEIPATSRSEKASEDSSARGNSWHESAEIESPQKNDDEEFHSDESQGVPDWLQEFKHGLFDKSVPEHPNASSSSHELPLEPGAKVVSGKDSIFTHFPKDRNCDMCLRTKDRYSRAQSGKIGDIITADHTVLSEGCESRHNHRYFVVVQDLATQWIQSYLCKTTTSQETQKSLQKFLEPTR